MSDGRWERLEQLFHAALPLDPEARAALLEKECRGDRGLLAEVERLLSASGRAGGFIEVPAAALAFAGPVDEAMIGRQIGAYRLVREIGRGGMGAVYLAERADGAFEQRVAIKLIKRGMDTDQVLARFRAERQILASLDHPNIARLLDGGTTDDGRPYFAMECIDGQPIDAYADAHRLTVPERLRLFLVVCEAVSHAHAQGVIHRDIKPLNILVSPGGVPKLLDFGIAKVLQDSPDDATSTVTGLRLLTPEYASPEQIEGRHATVASDVYALGVVLYELLTGHSPYRLTSRAPQDVAAVVCTTDPERPSTVVTQAPADTDRRPSRPPADHIAATGGVGGRQLARMLRGDLDTIILTALRKEPARRYSTVAAMAEDLRRHLDGRPVLARADALVYRLGKFARRNRAGLTASVLAVVGATLLAAAGIALSRSGPASEPSLLATRVLAPRDRILVADFVDRAGDTTLTAAVAEAFRIDLAQSAPVRVLTPRQVRASLETMQRAPDVALDDSLARELALREGVKAYVAGSLAKLSGAYTVSAQLIGAQTGEALASVRETAADSSGLIAAVDRASKALRRRIGESLQQLQGTPTLEQATTASLPALRKYTEGQRLFRAGQRTLALSRLQEAVALDTGFASAYVVIGMAYGSLGDIGRSFAAGEHALANQGRLPFLERGFLVGSAAFGRGDYAKAIEVYTGLLERFPDNVAAMNNLALAYRDARRYAPAESLFRRAAEYDSTIANFYYGLHSAQVLQGKFTEGRATMGLLARRFPGDPILLTEELQDAAAQQDWRRAERNARAQIAAAGADTLQLVDPIEALAGLAMTQGRIGEAERLWRDQFRVSRSAGAMGRHMFGVIQLAYLELRYRNAPARAVALVDSALAATPPDQLLPGDRRYDELARFFAAAGEPRRAHRLLEAAVLNDRSLGRVPRAERGWTRGVIALADGRVAEAEAELRGAADMHVCPICVLPDLGRAYEAAGKPDAAAATYERYLSTPWLWRYEPDAVELGWTTKRLGELYEQANDARAAARAYGHVLELWNQADAELAPTLADVRRRASALGEGGAAGS